MAGGVFDPVEVSAVSARLDASRLVRGPRMMLTPNLIVGFSRGALAAVLLTALLLGPESMGNVGQRFVVGYVAVLLALPSFPQLGGRAIGGGLALLLGIRWTFSALDGGTVAMLAAELAGVIFALVPAYARDIGRLAGGPDGYVSFTERRALWQRRVAANKAAKPVANRRPRGGRALAALADLRARRES